MWRIGEGGTVKGVKNWGGKERDKTERKSR
jgi:hypothetical protein